MNTTTHTNPMLICINLAKQLWPGLRVYADIAHRPRDAQRPRDDKHRMASVVEVYTAAPWCERNDSKAHAGDRRHRRSEEIHYDSRGVRGQFGWVPMVMTAKGEYEPQHLAAEAAWSALAGALTAELAMRATASPDEYAAHAAARTKESADRP